MIYTLNSRSNIRLDMMKRTFHLKTHEIFHLINDEWNEMVLILKRKGIKYTDLKSVLTPPHKSNRKEFVFCFDSEKISSCWYGNEIIKIILPLINKKRTHAILQGDFCVSAVYNSVGFNYMKEKLITIDKLSSGYWGQYFLIYINNLIQEEIDILLKGLFSFKGFLGYADMTYSNNFKDIIAYYLNQSFLQIDSKILLLHEDDRNNEENVNLVGYPYEDFGFEIYSIQEYYYSFFLEYKIESRMVNKSDLIFSLNVLSEIAENIDDYQIIIDDSKFEYIKQKNVFLIKISNINEMNLNEFKYFLHDQIRYSYIYNLEINQYNIAKFNTIVEKQINNNKTIRFLASFEYNPTDRSLRLLNFFEIIFDSKLLTVKICEFFRRHIKNGGNCKS